MILTEFPDLQWLKSQIAQRFKKRVGWRNMQLETEGFPSVIINTTTNNTYRPDVEGPVSIFMNIHGDSRCKVDNRTVQVNDQFFFVTNNMQPYTLEIEANKPVETFNIHFGEYFSESMLSALITPADKILNDEHAKNIPSLAFYNKLYKRDETFNRLAMRMYHAFKKEGFNKLLFEEQLTSLLMYLLQQHRHIVKAVQQLPPAKESTRIELYKRLSYALDYIHSAFTGNIDLETLSAAACLSKYHFLRLFKLAYGTSPHQYIQQLRLEKAKQLLKHSALQVNDIADAIGFENSQSFSRLFFQRMGVYPSQYKGIIN